MSRLCLLSRTATASARRCFSTAAAAAAAAASLTDPLLGLSEDQRALYSSAAAFAAAEIAPHAARWDAEGFFPIHTLRAAASLGLMGMLVRPEHGGTGLSRCEIVPIVEALAGACPSTAAYVTIHAMVGGMLDRFGSAELRERLLPRITAGECLTSYCLTEPDAGSDAASLQTRAERAPDGSFVLSGSKAFISGGGVSDLYLVMARTGAPGSGSAGISAFVVEKGAEGLTFGKNEKKMGWRCQPTAAVYFDRVRVPEANLVGSLGEGFKYAMQGLDGGRLSIAACSVGAANTCFDLARDHVKQRKQFGKPLAANQSVQFALSDMAADLLVSRSTVRSAAALLDEKSPLARSACAMAKQVATDKGFSICDRALQLHGGYGYLADLPIERFVRDTRVHRILEGTNEIMRTIVARAILQ